MLSLRFRLPRPAVTSVAGLALRRLWIGPLPTSVSPMVRRLGISVHQRRLAVQKPHALLAASQNTQKRLPRVFEVNGSILASPVGPPPARMKHAAILAVLIGFGGCALSAAPYKVDHHLPSHPDTVVWGYWSADSPPVLKIKSGEVVEIDTVSMTAMPDGEPEQFFKDHGISLDLPVVKDIIALRKAPKPAGTRAGAGCLTGPIYIEGCAPGDTLEVRVLDIKSRAPYGMNQGGPGRGGIPDLVPRYYSKFIPLDLERNVALYTKAIEIPLHPFQGMMAVAPTLDKGRLSSSPPYPDIGGNFDNKHLGKGATIYFPAQVEGALFQVGDPHAAQGNGEVSVAAIESSNTVTMQFIVRKDLKLKAPRAETPTHYIVWGLDVELSLAMRNAIVASIDFLKEAKGMTFVDALSLCSISVDYEVTEVVDGTKGIHAMIPKKIFEDNATASYWYKEDPAYVAAH